MQFAYIDSQGKEVGIPSVEALQLRIELGAVGEETMFFDARSGKWARAGEHEIFRTLVREVREDREENPFEVGDTDARTRDPELATADEGSEEDEVPEVLDTGSLLDHAVGPDAETEELEDFDLSAFEHSESDVPGGDELFLGGSELQLGEVGEEEPSSGSGAGSSPPGWFEAGPEEDGLQLEEAWKAGASSAADPDRGETDHPGPDVTAPEGTESAAGTPDAATAGMAVPEPVDRDPVDSTIGRSAQQDPAPAPDPGLEARRPANRRAPVRRGGSGMGKRMALAAVFVVAGAAGWFGWSALRGDSSTEEMEAAVVVPDLPPELEELHAQAVPGAVETLVESLRADAAALPEAPDEDWLGGEYLATASAFPGIEAYWNTLGTYLRDVRERDAEIFADAYAAELDQLAIPGPTSRERLLERAQAAFRAARADRADAYDRLDTLIAASLDLHEFLRANEERITYEPSAGGFSRDPVTEAIPASRELGDEMWSRVSRITAAMDALGTVDRLSTQGLVDFVLVRVAGTPVR